MKKFFYVVLILFGIAQIFRPKKNNNYAPAEPYAFYSETNTNVEIQKILKESCLDCHSNFTRYPLYAEITPINFFMANHVNEGKEHLNFNEWENYDDEKKEHKLDELVDMVKKSEMPLTSYTLIHKDAKLSEENQEILIEWAKDLEKNKNRIWL